MWGYSMIPICLSKRLADMSEEQLRKGEKPTLSERSPCFGCSGTNLNCRNYSNPNVSEEDKKRLQHEQMYGTAKYVLFDGDGDEN